MPVYEYRCSKCGDFEAMQKMSDKPLAYCPTCRRKVTKLISNTSFQLKGSGWYVTDYARKGSGGGKSESGDAAESESAKSEGTSATSESTSATSDAGTSAGSKDDGGGKPAKSKKKSTSATKAA